MSREKEFLNELRFNRIIKGNNPFIVTIGNKTNMFKIKARKYIITLSEDAINLYSLNFFGNKVTNKDNRYIKFKVFEEFLLTPVNQMLFSLTIYDKKDRCIELFISNGTKDHYFSEINFNYFIEELRKMNVKELSLDDSD